MAFNWTFYIHAGIIAAGLIIAMFLRFRIKFLQKFLIPNSIIAGFLLMPLYNFVFPKIGFNQEYLGEIAYHLLSISFIALSLRAMKRSRRANRNRQGHAVVLLNQYGVQAFVGIILTWIFMNTFKPDLFHSFGFLFPLGFALGPGQAFAIGEGWRVFGITDAGTVGLTFAALGFIMASFGGVFLIHYGIRHKWISPEYMNKIRQTDVKTGIFPRGVKLPVGSFQTTQTEAMDSLTANVIFILLCYVLSYFFLKAIGWLLAFAGPLGVELATNLWGISFIFAALVALLVRRIMDGLRIDHILDDRTLSRVSGLSVDIMVTSSIAAISLVVAYKYWLPILIVTVIGTILILILVPWMCSRVFSNNRFLRTIIIFGAVTGTLTTGLALLRVLDPEFETPVASDYSYASGITFAAAIPFILAINFPAKAFQTGDMRWFAAGIAVALGYIIFTMIWYMLLAKKKSFARGSQVWALDRKKNFIN
ncbi:MAG: sodium/glutamate symporter [Spirochaetales bacterium]|uniref:Sodium/glutamate symporter n=1 Tax=Candidatus Thalassospirochaeta sargassi TaxID=3119039 RepID=A0AAJ1IDC5_9SPIO|nr:sodium/glutamate symporter [Spirochaetales bacterium]